MFWNIIKERDKSITNITHDGIDISDPKSIANLLNALFHSVFSPLTQPSFHNLWAFSLDMNISQQGVLNLLLKLKTKSSVGPDNIPNLFLRRYAELLSKYLAAIFQASFESAVLPPDWKHARIVPILKKSDPSSVLSYCPIFI